jgi:uncharacterized protein YodC (DUF2158 family)
MDGEFKIGDVVQLNSGGPYMTVVWAGGTSPEVQATWLDSMGRGHTVRVPAACVHIAVTAAQP